MSFWQQMKKWFILQILIFYVFIITGFVVNFLQFLSVIVWPFSRPLYRKINVHLAYSLWSYLTTLGQYWSGSQVDLYISDEDLKNINKEHFISVMNHKYDIDWLMGWIICQRIGLLGGSKILGKSSLKLLPIIGWCWIFSESIFIRRQWEVDSKTIVKDFDEVMNDYPENYYFNILMFCEGTRFTKKKHEASVEFAKSRGLPILKHHLLPRTKGFCLLVKGAAGRINAIYDLNVGIEHNDTVKADLHSIRNGISLKSKILVRRIPLDKIPYDDEEKCSQFIYNLYKEKDDIFDTYARTGEFDYEKYGVKEQITKKNYIDLIITIGWIILVATPSLYYLFTFMWNASLLVKCLILLAIGLSRFGIEIFISVTQTERGSKYGLKENTKSQ